MKKYSSIALALVLVVTALTACTQANTRSAENGKLSVVTTIFPPYDFTRALAGDTAEVTMLLPPAAESHSFEPTPQDIIKVQNCDVFIYVGGDSDAWVDRILDSIDTSSIKVVTLMDCVDVLEEEIVGNMQDDEDTAGNTGQHSDDSMAGKLEYDEHVWTSPRNAKLIVTKISDALCEVDAANAATYRAHTTAYLDALDRLDAEFKAVVDTAARKTIVFGDRFPFRYFADAYGLQYDAAFPGCSSESEASARTVKGLIDKINAEKIPVVFHIELSNEKMAQSISEATGAKVVLLHACHNISKEDFEAGKTYLDLMGANVDALKEALH